MASIVNSLFPPIVDTYMPAFTVAKDTGQETSECRVYFSLSKFNILAKQGEVGGSKIRQVWVSISKQNTNESVVDSTLYPTSLIHFNLDKIYEDTQRQGDDRYYVILQAQDLTDKKWHYNEKYKVQLRFSSVEIENNNSALLTNLNYFSEWSTVCLIQGILMPILTINNFPAEAGDITFNYMESRITGMVKFDDAEYLDSYQIRLWKKDTPEYIEYDSGLIYTDSFNPNEINHALRYKYEEAVRYTLQVTYTTANLYSNSQSYDFLIIEPTDLFLNVDINVQPENELGRMKLHLTSTSERFFGTVLIQRASSKTNFLVWEEMAYIQTTGDALLNAVWYDYSIESGVWYKYSAHKVDINGNKGVATINDKPHMAVFEDIFFIGENGKQLKIKFNPQISSYSTVVSETSTQTIGSKYPFIRRNGNVEYRQFSISGLISYFMDDQNIFTNREELLGDYSYLYKNYNKENNVTDFNDFILEKQFRDRVQEFLCDGKVKLFKSATEGNILICLMNINFSPEQTLGRMLYSFSATAYEIDDISLETLERYNIQNVGTYSTATSDFVIKQESANLLLSANQGNIIDVLTAHVAGYSTDNVTYEVQSDTIQNIKIQFESDPYPLYFDPNGTVRKASWDEMKTYNPNISLGYLITHKGQPIVIPPHGIYDMSNSLANLDQGFSIEEGEAWVQCSYKVKITEQQVSEAAKTSTYDTHLGQVAGTVDSTQNIIQDFIYEKYHKETTDGFKYLHSIDQISIEADPFTVFYLNDSSSNEYKRFLINETGELFIMNEDFSINGLYFFGKHLTRKATKKSGQPIKEYTEDWEWEDHTYERNRKNKTFVSVAEIPAPVKNGVYQVASLDGVFTFFSENASVAGNDYFRKLFAALDSFTNVIGDSCYMVIYHYNNWYVMDPETHDIICPTYSIVNYIGEIETGSYVQ